MMGHPGPRAMPDPRELQETTALLGLRATRVIRVTPEHRALREPKATRVTLGPPGQTRPFLALLARPGLIRLFRGRRVTPVMPVLLVHRERQG